MHKLNLFQRVLIDEQVMYLSPIIFLSKNKDIFCWLLQQHMASFETSYGTSYVLHYHKPQTKIFLFQFVDQKIKILDKIKFNQEILTILLRRMHHLSINLPCNSDYKTTYRFFDIKHFYKRGKTLQIHFYELL